MKLGIIIEKNDPEKTWNATDLQMLHSKWAIL